MLPGQSSDQGRLKFLRATLIGLFLVPPNLIWLVQTELVRGVYPTWLTLFPNVIFILFSLTILSCLLKRIWPQFALSGSEISIIYVILSVSTAIFARDSVRILFHYIGAGHWYATPENDWAALFWKHLPNWLTVSDPKTLERYYMGGESLYLAEYFQFWAQPLFIWGMVAFVTALATTCISGIMHRQSSQYERLSYPVIQLPLYMIDADKGLLRSRLMWIGFAVAGGIDLLNGAHFFYPVLPHLDMRIDLRQFFPDEPWSAMGFTPLCFYPFAVGFSYMMPVNLSFSCWLFYLLLKVQLVLRSAVGIGLTGYGRNAGHQTFGAWLCLGMVWIWAAKRHLWQVFLLTIGKTTSDNDKETISYRSVVGVLIVAISTLIIFSVKAGMAVWVAISFIVVYLFLALSVARLRAQLGPPTHDIDQIGPEELLIACVGTRRVGTRSLGVFPLFSWLGSWNYRGHPIGPQIEGLKMAEKANLGPSQMLAVIISSIGLTVLIGPWIYIWCAYDVGIDLSRSSHVGLRLYKRWASRLLNLPGTDWVAIQEIGIGSGVILILSVMQRLYLFWPLHPLGYAICGGSYIMHFLWFSVFIGWFCKMMVIKSSGVTLYRRLSFFFLGLLLGQFVVGSTWTLLGIITQAEVYGFFP